MSKGIVPMLIEYQGQLYIRYTSPYMSQVQAERKVESLYAGGEIDSTDQPIIQNRAVYIRAE